MHPFEKAILFLLEHAIQSQSSAHIVQKATAILDEIQALRSAEAAVAGAGALAVEPKPE
jgi:hypothetical protein